MNDLQIFDADSQSQQDIYSSSYRPDNESDTDDEAIDDDEESSDDDDDFKSRIGKIATRTSLQGKVRIQSSKEKEDKQDEEEEMDEFEADMQKEMEQRVYQAEKEAAIANEEQHMDVLELEQQESEEKTEEEAGGSATNASKEETEKDKEKYDDIYFDSDDEDEGRKTEKRKMMTDDDLLYDPNMDDDDQTWVDDVRRSYQQSGQQKNKENNPKPLANSDAVLNCPACFTVVCLDCQRHELYKTQYRAMFVINCSVNTEEIMKLPVKKRGKGKKGKTITHPDDEYHPVRCDQCRTEIAMYDKDEVYHFFNVVASHT